MITETINGLTYDFYSFKGKVLGSSKYSSTHVYGGGGNQYGSYPVRSYETVHDIIFIEDAGGKEHEIHMKNWDIGVREGHELLLVWAVQKGRQTGPYLYAKNLNTGMTYTANNTIKNMSRYNFLFLNLNITVPLTAPFVMF